MFGHKKKLDRLKLVQTISHLRVMENKIRYIEDRIRRNAEEKFNELIKHSSRHDKSMAQIIANEVAEQRKLAESIEMLRLSIERVRLRLETILDVGGTVDMLKSLSPLLKDVRKTSVGAIPEIGLMFSELEEKLTELGVEMDTSPIYESPGTGVVEVNSEDIQKILREAEEMAAEREKHRLPKPP